MTQPLHVLITGASSGIGLHLAHAFARGGHELTVIAPVVVTPPSCLHLAGECRAFAEASLALLSLAFLPRPALAGAVVLVVPGFCANDALTWPLRRYLLRCGAHVVGWGQGINRGPRPGVMDRLDAVIEDLQQTQRRPVTLVGWSLGGLLCRVAAARREAGGGGQCRHHLGLAVVYRSECHAARTAVPMAVRRTATGIGRTAAEGSATDSGHVHLQPQ